jgi:hypothetical protein
MQVSFLPIVKGICSPGTADHQAEVFEKAANMVLEIALDLDQQRLGWPAVLRPSGYRYP